MLVCFVVAPGLRRTITVDIVEAAGAAVDLVTDAGFGRLLDEPAVAVATADAFLGELMLEATSAIDTQNAGLSYAVLLDEPANAADTFAGIYAGGIDVDVAEAATAASAQDATVTGAAVRSAMVPGVFINATTPREAQVDGVMLNL